MHTYMHTHMHAYIHTIQVNEKLLRVTQAGRDLTLAAGNLEKLQDAAKCIRAQIKVPVIQGCLQYAYKTDVSSTFEPDDESNVLPSNVCVCLYVCEKVSV